MKNFTKQYEVTISKEQAKQFALDIYDVLINDIKLSEDDTINVIEQEISANGQCYMKGAIA